MENIVTSKFFNSILLLTIIGEFLLPWILERYYERYDRKTMGTFNVGAELIPGTARISEKTGTDYSAVYYLLPEQGRSYARSRLKPQQPGIGAVYEVNGHEWRN